MPLELGGSGVGATPSWLLRAGLSSCAAASIILAAATEGIELTALDVRVTGWLDVRGIHGIAGAQGEPASAGPGDIQHFVRICAHGVSAERLRALVDKGTRRSPLPFAVLNATPLAVHIDLDAALCRQTKSPA
ncbi:OsmC family protein (fragment) [Burkholderiales bacterium]|jgi:uncharacterized OsmC-like protein